MKIAIPANAPNMDAKVEQRLGMSAYLLVIDTETMDLEAFPGSFASAGPGAGIRAITLVLNKGVCTILAGYISPHIARTLRDSGIEVMTSVEGKVGDVVEKYKRGELHESVYSADLGALKKVPGEKLKGSVRKSANQFTRMLPVLVGVILLVGLFRAFISKNMLLFIFSEKPFYDTLSGALMGSLFVGNPVNSYVIGESLLKMGVSLFAVTAMIVTWVSVGLVQLPAEISALGKGFAVIRNATAFIVSILVALLTVFVVGLFRWTI